METPNKMLSKVNAIDLFRPENEGLGVDISPLSRSAFYCSQIQEIRASLIELYEDKDFNELLSSIPHDENLDYIKNILELGIKLTESLFKTFIAVS